MKKVILNLNATKTLKGLFHMDFELIKIKKSATKNYA